MVKLVATAVARSGDFLSLSDLQSCIPDAFGVGHCITCADNFGSPRLFHLPFTRFTESSATGVCHIIPGDHPDAATSTRLCGPLLLLPWFGASGLQVGVGMSHDPDPLPFVRRANVGSSQHSPFRIKPQRGQVSKNSSESPRSECWAVFHEDEAGLYFANDPCHFSPHAAALAVDACAFSCGADVLARKSATNDVNNSSPWFPVKSLHVIPNRERRETSVVLSCHKHGLGVGLPLDGAHCSVSDQLAGENSATNATEKMKLIHEVQS